MAPESPSPPEAKTPARPGAFRRLYRALAAHPARTGIAVAALILALLPAFADLLLARPMRAWAERTMNAKLNGYTVNIGSVRPHLWRMAFDLEQVTVTQHLHPTPPVAEFKALAFSLLFRDLVRFRLAGDLTLLNPRLHIDAAQIMDEARSHVSIKERGWQGAVESIYPIKLNQVRVLDGALVYLSLDTADKPLQLTRLAMVATNIRNTAAERNTYPSPVTLDGVLFDSGSVTFRGAADFLREPFFAAQGEIRLVHVPLDRLAPIAREYQVRTTGGFLSVTGRVESTPELRTAQLGLVLLEDLDLEYVTSSDTKVLEAEHRKQAVQLARTLHNAPRLRLQVDHVRLSHTQLGFWNRDAHPPYRLYLSTVDLDLFDLNNQPGHGPSRFQAKGLFMGQGPTEVSGTFQPSSATADAAFRLRLDDAQVPALNPFLLANTGVDVAAGQLSLYTELVVRNGRVEGYIKPFLRDLEIYDRRKDHGKPLGKRVEMHVLQFLSGVFRNRSSQAVATVIRISGSTRAPHASEWEVIRKLLGNGLFHAIVPGFQGGAPPAKVKASSGASGPPTP
jgi:hypothetical protein